MDDPVALVEQELASLGLDEPLSELPEEDPEVSVAVESADEPTGVDDSDEADDREFLAQAAEAQARAIDQLGAAFEVLFGHFQEARRATRVLAEAAARVAAMDDSEGEEDDGEVPEEG